MNDCSCVTTDRRTGDEYLVPFSESAANLFCFSCGVPAPERTLWRRAGGSPLWHVVDGELRLISPPQQTMRRTDADADDTQRPSIESQPPAE